MVFPVAAVAAGAAAVARFIATNGVREAIKKFGKSKVQSAMRGVKGSKRKQVDRKKSEIDFTSIPNIGRNPAIQQAKPPRMPAQKTTQGPPNPKGMGFSKGGRVQRPAKIF